MIAITRRYAISLVFTSGLLLLTFLSLSVYADCGTSLGAPHQGAGQYPAPGNFIYGISADISYNMPVLGCLNNIDSFTNEWIMVVGPGPEEWLQFGWERKSGYPNVHLWCQYHHQGASPVDGDIPYEPATVHEYMILSVRDPATREITWQLFLDDLFMGQFTATEMGWTQPENGAAQAQWSAELSYGESEMGGLLPHFVFFDDIYYQEGTPTSSWYHVDPSWTFDSFVPKYGGDTVEYEPFRWRSRNWTWRQIHLPLVTKDF